MYVKLYRYNIMNRCWFYMCSCQYFLSRTAVSAQFMADFAAVNSRHLTAVVHDEPLRLMISSLVVLLQILRFRFAGNWLYFLNQTKGEGRQLT